VAKSTTSIRFSEDLVDALDRRAAAEGLTRSQLVVRAVERALAERSTWSPAFLKAITSPRPELDDAVDELMEAVRAFRSRSEAPAL
jgi:predicted transcriptional regulator